MREAWNNAMEIINLNGKWDCQLPDGTCLSVDVPGCFDTYTPRKDIGEAVIYRRIFTFAPTKEAKRIKERYFLFFWRVSYYCDIYLNQQLVGSHEGMWDPFMVEVTSWLRTGENQLCIEVIKPGYYETDRFPLRQVLSGFIPDVLHTFGGLWGEVTLCAHTSLIVKHHHARGIADGNFDLIVDIDVLSDNSDIDIDAKVFSSQGKEVWGETHTVRRETG